MLLAPKPHSGVVVEPGLESRAHNSGSNSRPVCLPLAMYSVVVSILRHQGTGKMALTDNTNLRQT